MNLLLDSESKSEVMTPAMDGDHLLLVRRVAARSEERIEGCWLDWPVIRD